MSNCMELTNLNMLTVNVDIAINQMTRMTFPKETPPFIHIKLPTKVKICWYIMQA